MTERKLRFTRPRFTIPQCRFLLLLFVSGFLCGGGPLTGQEPGASQGPAPAASQEEPTTENEKQPKAEDDASEIKNETPPKTEPKGETPAEESEEMAPGEETPSEGTAPASEGKPKADDPAKKEAPPVKPSPKRVIGATERIQELQSGFIFLARIDTGAKSCSLHVDEMKIEDEEEKMLDNVGKTIHFLLRNGNEKTFLAKAKIRSVVRIKNANGMTKRYKVRMEFQCKNIKKRVLVTLNDRGDLKYPLLLGRNFLRNDFLVDVDVNSTD